MLKIEITPLYHHRMQLVKITHLYCELPSAVTLGGAYDEGGASAEDQRGHMICCSGR